VGGTGVCAIRAIRVCCCQSNVMGWPGGLGFLLRSSSPNLFAFGVRRFQCMKSKLQLQDVFCEISVLHARGRDFAQQGLVAINVGAREGEQGGPTGSEGNYGCRPQRSRHSTGPAPSEEANELGSLGTPAAANLTCKENTPAPLRAQRLRVGAFLSPANAPPYCHVLTTGGSVERQGQAKLAEQQSSENR